MLCKFCQHEFDARLTECPYCHRLVEVEVQPLTREERDNFSGATIEADGTIHEGDEGAAGVRQDNGYESSGDGAETTADGSGIHVYHTGGLMTWLIIALVLIGIVFFLLPAFIFIAIAGAVAGAVVLFFLRLFQ